ncbi:MAG: DMT family transporter [Acidobacteria bacterium]|nr:DMT family transporter [Acidobacteriota bacterium]
MEAEITKKKIRGRPVRSIEEGEIAQAYLYMLWGASAFAVMGALSHLAGERCGWQIVAAARTSVAFVFSLAVAFAWRVRLVLLRPRVLWMRSLVGSVGVLSAFYALTHLPISTALTLSNTFPVWVALLAWPVLGERPTASVWVAVVAGLAGVVLIQRPDAQGSYLASFSALGNAVCTAVAMIGLNRLRGVDARAVVVHFSGVSTVVCLALLVFSGAGVDYVPLGDARLLATLVGVGLAGAAGQLGMTRAFALGNPSKVAVVGLMQIVFACAFDLLFWRRHFDARMVCGILLVTAPTAWLLAHSPLRRSASIHLTN